MDIKHKRVLRTFATETRASWLLGFANKGNYSEDVKRALDVIAELNSQKTEKPSGSPKLRRMLQAAEISAPIARVELRPCLAFLGSGWFNVWEFKGSESDANVLMAIVEAATLGTLDQLRKCHCGKYFSTRRKDQRFHSARCREKKYKSTEEWKAHRREYMRDYYDLQKSGKVK